MHETAYIESDYWSTSVRTGYSKWQQFSRILITYHLIVLTEDGRD